ncbi:hydantoinase/oxoprolinase family protein [Celeribacter indicus]
MGDGHEGFKRVEVHFTTMLRRVEDSITNPYGRPSGNSVLRRPAARINLAATQFNGGSMYRIGVDVGGTFTDFTLLNEADGGVLFHKVSSTPSDPSRAIVSGMREFLELHGFAASDVSFVGHGTTVATNLTIERKGARTALITTKGFRDVLEIGRQTRPNLYDYQIQNPKPLVRRKLRFEVEERILADGTVQTPIRLEDLDRIVEALKAEKVEAAAICFLHSYRNPEHECAAEARLREAMPGLYITRSSGLLPEFREFERMSTTVLNAYAGPRMQSYLDSMAAEVKEMGVTVTPYTIHSNGGLMSIPTVRQYPVRTCLSGPAAGVVGSAGVAREAGFENVVTFDVGGTSTDVSIIVDGQPQFTSNRTVADYPVKTPMIDIHVIGAGGGSIAWMDDAHALKVGPQSAGAVPGPVAYGRGGEQPTVTDANVILHRLSPVSLLDGKLDVQAEAAHETIRTRIAEPLGIGVDDAATGILRIANANMGRAIRSVSTERGHDLSQFALMAFGGAGPIHACDVAAECGIPTVIIPREPGTMCARGILLSEISLDFVKTYIDLVDAQTWPDLIGLFSELRKEGRAWLASEQVEARMSRFQQVIEARYVGQNFEVSVPVEQDEALDYETFVSRFSAVHHSEYGYSIPGRAIEVVNCRLKAIGLVPRPYNLFEAPEDASVEAALIERRMICYDPREARADTPVYSRAKLPIGDSLLGPAVIEEMSSTTLIPPGTRFHVDRAGNIIITNIRMSQ